MGWFSGLFKACKSQDPGEVLTGSGKDILFEILIAGVLGLFSFLSFCFVRPRWQTLYAARKQQGAEPGPPELSNSFFGWIPTLWAITEREVLAVAGLDAFVVSRIVNQELSLTVPQFLSFFKTALKFLGITFFLATTILLPINKTFVGLPGLSQDGQDVSIARKKSETGYMWAYLVFTYVFTAIAIYLFTKKTQHIIRVRHDYLGSHTSAMSRTFRLAGIPPLLRNEENVKEMVENLGLGSVENVTLCKDWSKLDKLMDQRNTLLRKLEEAWSVHNGNVVVSNPDGNNSADEENNAATPLVHERPTTRIGHGFWNLNSQKVDAIDYYQEELRKLDEKIEQARKMFCVPTQTAFVTMESATACQQAINSQLNSEPKQLLAFHAPAPSDVIWRNTYLTWNNRVLRAWMVTLAICVLTVFWTIVVAALAAVLSKCSIDYIWPRLGEALETNVVGRFLVQTLLPVAIISGLNAIVPFLYYALASSQGFISQSDLELSVISKNFMFSFWNFFLVFTVAGSATDLLQRLTDSARSPETIPTLLADVLKRLGVFYTNLIVFQGLGLVPLQLLQISGIFNYWLFRMGLKTPRDREEIEKPPAFIYGLYLPTALLILILCTAYSILANGFLVLLFGIVYFTIGYWTYKYQLMYAMVPQQQATGRAWSMIFYRVMLGLVVFQLAMCGVITSIAAAPHTKHHHYQAAVAVLPLVLVTILYSYHYSRTYAPYFHSIALSSIDRGSRSQDKENKYENPRLVEPLEEPRL